MYRVNVPHKKCIEGESMLLGQFLIEYHHRKEEKKAFNNICRENGISYKKLPELLKSFGYVYNQQMKEWTNEKPENEQPLDINLVESIPARRSPAAVQHTHSTEDPAEARQQIAAAAEEDHTRAGSIAPALQENIVYDQLHDIALILQQINNKIPDRKAQPAIFDPALDDPEAAPLALQLHRINQHAKARKTINVSEGAAAWLNAYADTKGHNIGDLVSLAVMQLQKRIDPAYKAKE